MQCVQATGMVDERPRSGMARKTIRINDRLIDRRARSNRLLHQLVFDMNLIWGSCICKDREQRKVTHKTAATVNRSSAASVESIT